ncbi:MAG: SpoIIE family protein phosphatase [Chitinispirillaceae bacterium]|nr:SpoIIE family protein phosphatase [Chitinispirillaceae bacterium]
MATMTTPFHTPHSIFKNGLPCIGVLVEELTGVYQKGIWPGIVDTAKKHGLNCLCFTGGTLLKSPVDVWQYQRNLLYDFAQQYPLSGLIVFGSLVSYVEEKSKSEFIARFGSCPLVTLTPTQEGVPAIYADNRSGFRQLITHLIEEHGCRSFAFVTGPAWNSEATKRLDVLSATLDSYGLSLSADGIFPGTFDRESGSAAARALADRIDAYDVLVTADDQSALGAIETFTRLGIAVPEQIAVTGFDDIEEAAYCTPPLTTVRQPLYGLGELAVTTLVRCMRREIVDEHCILDAPFVVRQSCGCFERQNPAITGSPSSSPADPVAFVLSSIKAPTARLNSATRRVLSSFFGDIPLRRDDRFLKRLIEVARKEGLGERHLAHWSKTLSAMQEYCRTYFDHDSAAFASSLALEASSILTEMTYRSQGYARIEDAREYMFIHDTGALITNSLSLSDMADTIAKQLPRLGIDTFHISLFDEASSTCDRGRQFLSVIKGRNVPIATDTTYPSASLLPGPLIENAAPAVYIIEPLYFQSSQFGFALFEGGSVKTDIYPILGGYISSALLSRLLIDRMEKQSASLKEANDMLVALRSKERAYLESVKGELELGQKIQMSFLPHEIPQLQGWEMDALFMPAREVSGDFYDTFLLDDNTLAMVIGDVSGKDISAALFMSRIQILLRALTEQAFTEGKALAETITTVNEYIARQYKHAYTAVMFSTLFYGFLDLDTGRLRFINAGHLSPIIIHKGTLKAKLPQTGPAIGLDATSSFNEEEIILEQNDLFFAYTDGVTEAKNPSGDFFSAARLGHLFIQKSGSAQEIVSSIKRALTRHMQDAAPYDDITVLAVYRG